MAPPIIPKPGHRKLPAAANLSKLLPTGTVLVFQALIPSFANNGSCIPTHKVLTLAAIISFPLVCPLSSFTDSFIATNGKLYYGIATRKGLYIFNKNKKGDEGNIKEGEINGADDQKKILAKYRIRFIDFVHAFCLWLVFVVYTLCSSDVMRCFYPHPNDNVNVLMMNLPLAVGSDMSFLFMLLPTKRRGIGYADKGTPKKLRDRK